MSQRRRAAPRSCGRALGLRGPMPSRCAPERPIPRRRLHGRRRRLRHGRRWLRGRGAGRYINFQRLRARGSRAWDAPSARLRGRRSEGCRELPFRATALRGCSWRTMLVFERRSYALGPRQARNHGSRRGDCRSDVESRSARLRPAYSAALATAGPTVRHAAKRTPPMASRSGHPSRHPSSRAQWPSCCSPIPALTQDLIVATLQGGAHRLRARPRRSGRSRRTRHRALSVLEMRSSGAASLPSRADSWLTLGAELYLADGSTPFEADSSYAQLAPEAQRPRPPGASIRLASRRPS